MKAAGTRRITDDDDIAGKLAEHMGIPDEYKIVCILPVGKADEEITLISKNSLKAWYGLTVSVRIKSKAYNAQNIQGGTAMNIFSKIAAGLKKTKDSMMGKLEALINSFTKIDEDFLRSWRSFS